MTSSIKSRLMLGLAISGLAGSVLLAIAVAYQYGLFSPQALSQGQAQLEILEHVVLPLALFLSLFAVGAYIVILGVERQLHAVAEDALNSARELKAYQAPVEKLPSELRPFVTSLNALTSQLDLHARRQEAFASDAAHELKTPLTLLALELDRVPAESRQPLLEHVRNLSDMIDQLLLLARCNSTILQQADSEIDPDRLARRIVSEMAPAALDAGRTLALEIRSPLPFRGLEEAVSAAVRTIVDNALRATPEGGSVTIVAGPGQAIAILDGGQGLSAEALAKLKARGVRADSAPGGHAGLGLAIADRIMSAHGGELQSCLPQAAGIRLDFTQNRSSSLPSPA